MQNITVKVCYKGKTLIVGKGLNSIEEITKQLVKRFPEVDQLKSSLTVEYENGADDLSTAYELAQKESRRFIKVKFVSGEQNDTSFVSERFDDTCVLSILDVNQGKETVTDFIKSDQTKIQSIPENEPKSEAFQNLDDRAQVKIQNTLIDASLKKQPSSSEQTLLAADKGKEASGKKSASQIQVRENLLEEASEEKPQQEQTEVLIDYGLLDDYAPQKQQKSFKAPTKDEKREMFAKLFGADNSEQAKKQESLNSESMAVLQIVRKEFDTKISTLQAQYDDLQIKYNDLSSKYDNLSIAFGVQNEVKLEPKSEKEQNWFEQNWQEPKSLKNPKLLPIEQHYVQIQEFQTIEAAVVGENVQSTFRFKNVGMKKWPENVFAQEKNTQDLIDVKSLEPKHSAIVTLQNIKAQKVGDKINKTYQLVYFDKNNNLRKFGRVFGISVKVVSSKSVDPSIYQQKPEPIKPSNMKKTDPIIEFRAFIDEIMKKNKLVKNLYDVIASLKEYDVTEQNYKNCEIKTLTEFIRSICH